LLHVSIKSTSKKSLGKKISFSHKYCALQSPLSTRTKKMKVKAIVVTLAALGLAWTGASWYTGKQAEDWYRAETEKANVRLKEAGFPNDLSAAIASYERGVFSSKVHFALRLPERCGLPKELVLIDALNHGPFPWSQIKQGNLRPALLASAVV
jgi:uncharacterized protein YdgA (DUF945 family)